MPTATPWIPKPGRIPCAVLGCRRTAPEDKHPKGTRIICGKHWRRVLTVEARRAWSRWRTEADSLRVRLDKGTLTPDQINRLSLVDSMADGIWDDALAKSNEQEAGL